MKTLALEHGTAGTQGENPNAGRIGPNAIIQLGEAVRAELGAAARDDLFRRAGLTAYLDQPPTAMVDEAEVIALHRALRGAYPPSTCRKVSWEAGLLTGDYILANRIPKPAQWVLRLLPAPLAAKALTTAIGKHSWTFAGSGTFRVLSTRPLRLEIAGSPICRGERSPTPLCDYYAGTFTRLYRTLVDRRLTIRETRCGAVDGGACLFEAGTEPARHPGA
jgi:divinyl protochlorophyllide a 8-vinyl-reductase